MAKSITRRSPQEPRAFPALRRYVFINGNKNFAGEGINHTARAMAAAGENEIVVTALVHGSVHQHAIYNGRLERFTTEIKGTPWTFYSYAPLGTAGPITLPDHTRASRSRLSRLADKVDREMVRIKHEVSEGKQMFELMLWFQTGCTRPTVDPVPITVVQDCKSVSSSWPTFSEIASLIERLNSRIQAFNAVPTLEMAKQILEDVAQAIPPHVADFRKAFAAQRP